MTTFEERRLGSVPALIARPETVARHAILWFHGFGVDKGVHKPELEQLANAGFLAVGIDAVGHGARRWPDLDARIAAPRDDAKATMLSLARATAVEVGAVIDELLATESIEGAGIAGVSMGGYVVYGAIGAHPRIRAAVAILGAPDLLKELPPRVPILSITAECDESVPPHATRAFHASLSPMEHSYLELRGAQHLLSENEWKRALDETIQWFRRM